MEISEARKRKNLISLTPLIDVVFILLIFFMLASSFVEWKFFELGVSESEAIPLATNKHSLIIVDFDNKYSLNGNPTELVKIVSSVREQIRLQLDHSVLIQPVKNLPLQELVIVLDAVGAVAESNISLVKDER